MYLELGYRSRVAASRWICSESTMLRQLQERRVSMEVDVDKHEISFQAIVVLSLAWRGDTIDGRAHPLVGCVFPMGPCVFVNTITTTSETVIVYGQRRENDLIRLQVRGTDAKESGVFM